MEQANELAAACCVEKTQVRSPPVCPNSATRGRSVSWETVAALTSGPLPLKTAYLVCEDPDCDVVYFSVDGCSVVNRSNVRHLPLAKAGLQGQACFCFDHRLTDILDEIDRGRQSRIVESIRTATREKKCACSVRNPTGRCCLGDIKKALEHANSTKGA